LGRDRVILEKNLCIAGGEDNNIKLIDFLQEKVALKFPNNDHKTTINQVVWHPNK